MKPNTSVADSVVLACLSFGIAGVGFLLVLTSYAILSVALWYGVLPVLLVLTLFFWFRDLRRKLYREAKIAGAILLPVLLYELWLFAFTRLDF
ncbi:MAG TPA: hypothetical protein VMT53_26325 [Terriglobales bacterium]|nr:hypothetical protein [Terriglobales bacterium]